MSRKFVSLLSFSIGLILIFALQILNTCYSILINSGILNGEINDNMFFKSNLLLIPIVFIVIAIILFFTSEKSIKNNIKKISNHLKLR